MRIWPNLAAPLSRKRRAQSTMVAAWMTANAHQGDAGRTAAVAMAPAD